MRLLNWNIEWMNDWFHGGSQVSFRESHPNRGITDVHDLATRVAQVILDVDADVVTIQEGPSDPREMRLFTDGFLIDADENPLYDVFGGIDGGAQKIYCLVKKEGRFCEASLAQDALTQALSDPWEADVDGDLQIEGYEFTRLPLVVVGKVAGQTIRVVSLHTKSKYVHNGENLWNDPARKNEFIRAAMKNRRRISAEAMRTRRYIDQLLAEAPDAQIMVTGDFNDGPGIDFFELRYLTHNITDILLGSSFRPQKLFTHAFLNTMPQSELYTAIFDDFVDNIQNRPLVLDHILLSPALAEGASGRICHEAFNDAIDDHADGRQRCPSDHRPVLVEI